MRQQDQQLGTPFVDFTDTKVNIEAIAAPIGGMTLQVLSCKLTVILLCGIVIRLSRFFICGEVTQANKFSIEIYTRLPFVFLFNYTLIIASAGALLFTITRIFGVSAYSQITSLIIESVSVNVVNYISGACSHYYYWHYFCFSLAKRFTRHSLSAECFGMLVECGVPFMLIEIFKIIIIHQCYLTLRQLNFFSHVSPIENARLMRASAQDRRYSKSIVAVLANHVRAILPQEVFFA